MGRGRTKMAAVKRKTAHALDTGGRLGKMDSQTNLDQVQAHSKREMSDQALSNFGRTMMKRLVTLFMATALVISFGTRAQADSAGDKLASQIEEHVQQALKPLCTSKQAVNATKFERLAVTGTWTDVWPDGRGGHKTLAVRGRILERSRCGGAGKARGGAPAEGRRALLPRWSHRASDRPTALGRPRRGNPPEAECEHLHGAK